MNVQGIIAEVDGEISRLESIKALLLNGSSDVHSVMASGAMTKTKLGRPAGAKKVVPAAAGIAGKKGGLSVAGRKRISEALKKRHAEKKAALNQ